MVAEVVLAAVKPSLRVSSSRPGSFVVSSPLCDSADRLFVALDFEDAFQLVERE